MCTTCANEIWHTVAHDQPHRGLFARLARGDCDIRDVATSACSKPCSDPGLLQRAYVWDSGVQGREPLEGKTEADRLVARRVAGRATEELNRGGVR